MFPKSSILGFLLLFSIFTLLVADESVANKKEKLLCLSTDDGKLTITDEPDTNSCSILIQVKQIDDTQHKRDITYDDYKDSILGDKLVENGIYLFFNELGGIYFESNVSLKLDGSLEQLKRLVTKEEQTIFKHVEGKINAEMYLKHIEEEYFAPGKILDPENVKAILPTTTTTTTTTEIPRTTKISTTNAPTTNTSKAPVNKKKPIENFTEQTTIDDMSTTSMAIASGMLSVVFITLCSLF